MTSASCASPTDTSHNELFDADASTTEEPSRRRSANNTDNNNNTNNNNSSSRKRKSRSTASPSSSRAAHSDVDSGEDAEETARPKRTIDLMMPPPPPPAIKARRRRKISAVAVALLSATASNRSDSDDSGGNELETDIRTLGSVLSVEESLESTSVASSVPAPAPPRTRSRARRTQPSAGSEERAPTILDSAEDAEGEDTDALDATVAVRHRLVRSHRRQSSRTASLSLAKAFAMPDVTRRRRVRIAAALDDGHLRSSAGGELDRKGVLSEDAATIAGGSSGTARLSSGDNDAGSSAAANSSAGRGTASVVEDVNDSDDYDRDDNDNARSHVDDSKGDEDDDAIEAFEEHLAAEEGK